MGPSGTGLPPAMRTLLDEGGVILTANARAARSLDLRYARDRRGEGVTAWPTPCILDLRSWLTSQWQALLLTGTEDRLLLHEPQERALWQDILTPQLKHRSLIAPSRMARLAQEAYGLLAAYGAMGALMQTAWGQQLDEPELFRRWARDFQQKCARGKWLSVSELLEAITHALRWGALAPPPAVGWFGFDIATPAEAELRSVFDAQGVRQQTLAWEATPAAPPVLYCAPGERDEVAACAAWARAQLYRDPHARIGILMPDLTSRRTQLERALYPALCPETFPITAGAVPALSFEFSLGQPLGETPPVRAALLLLRWLRGPLAQQEISWLLLSSTLAAGCGDDARGALAQWDARLRNRPCAPPEMTMEALLRAPQGESTQVRALRTDLAAMAAAHRRAANRALPGVWVERTAELLRLARWGESAPASSLLFQVYESWERLLDRVASLDFMDHPLSYAKFLETLEHAACETIFSAESADAPVQAMGAFAAAGQAFDAVWFLGATDTAWPVPGRPNPLLPFALQRERGMPHATPAQDTALAHRVMDRLHASTGQVVYSCALTSEEAMQRPSVLVKEFLPLADDFATPASDSATTAVTWECATTQPVALETVADDCWVPVAAAASGGQMTLKRQADCPFQAFLFHRLHVRELPIAGRGLSALDRGSLLHDVMQRLWSRDIPGFAHLAGHAALVKATAEATLRPRVTAHVAAALRSLCAAQDEPWERAYLAAERERVTELVLDWLALEQRREPFTVETVEEKIDIQVGELALKVRADRIDAVAGGRLLIDYKTGEVSTASWEGPRPEQPQLPLYAAFGGTQQLIGALFAQVRQPEMRFAGRIEDARTNLFLDLSDKSPLITLPYTSELVEQWRDVLLALAGSFTRGEASVDPRAYPKTCAFCPLDGVCRVAESHGLTAGESALEEGDA